MLKTRSGRLIKQPERYNPGAVKFTDDYDDGEYDDLDAMSDVSSTVDYSSDEDMSDSDESFICGSDDDTDYEENEENEEEEAEYNSDDDTDEEE